MSDVSSASLVSDQQVPGVDVKHRVALLDCRASETPNRLLQQPLRVWPHLRQASP